MWSSVTTVSSHNRFVPGHRTRAIPFFRRRGSRRFHTGAGRWNSFTVGTVVSLSNTPFVIFGGVRFAATWRAGETCGSVSAVAARVPARLDFRLSVGRKGREESVGEGGGQSALRTRSPSRPDPGLVTAQPVAARGRKWTAVRPRRPGSVHVSRGGRATPPMKRTRANPAKGAGSVGVRFIFPAAGAGR